MAELSDITTYARLRVRDTGTLFQAEANGDGLATVFTLNVICVAAEGLVVVLQPDDDPPKTLTIGVDYQLNAMEGQIRLLDGPAAVGSTLYIEGTHYLWFTDEYIESIAPDVIGRLEYDEVYSFDDAETGTPEFEVAAAGVIVEMLWAVLTEQSFDIDLRDPEGVDFPINQRVAQLERLLQEWNERYSNLSKKLNIGIDRIEVGNLRRVSRTTGRLVPLYTEQEIDDTTAPVRLHPPIDKGA